MSGSSPATAYIGFGSNLGEGRSSIQRAWKMLAALPGIAPLALSSPYRTSPFQLTSLHWFTNAVGVISTTLSPHQLLDCLLDVEKTLGRDRSRGRDRTMDLDILSYEGLVLDEPNLTLPHPELHKRLFVLVPLAELDPDWRHPVMGLTALQLQHHLGHVDQQIEISDWTS